MTHRKMKPVALQNATEPHLMPKGLGKAPPPFKRLTASTTIKTPVRMPTLDHREEAPRDVTTRREAWQAGKGVRGRHNLSTWRAPETLLFTISMEPSSNSTSHRRSKSIWLLQSLVFLERTSGSAIVHSSRSDSHLLFYCTSLRPPPVDSNRLDQLATRRHLHT